MKTLDLALIGNGTIGARLIPGRTRGEPFRVFGETRVCPQPKEPLTARQSGGTRRIGNRKFPWPVSEQSADVGFQPLRGKHDPCRALDCAS